MSTDERLVERQNPRYARSREAVAFLDTLQSVPANAVTACHGWTAHEIIAHLTAGAVALSEQIEAHLAGEPVPPFGSWEERDNHFRRMEDSSLRHRLDRAEEHMSHLFHKLIAADPNTTIPGGGWGFSATHLDIHMREEFALHRWDLIGDDDEGDVLLGQPELLEHSVDLLDQWLLTRGLEQDSPVSDPFHARIRSPEGRDVVLTVENRVGSLSFATPLDGVDLIETDAAGRLLLIWGRAPRDSRRVLSTMPADHLMRFCTLLSGF